MQHALHYAGYTMSLHASDKAHSAEQSSSWFMNLVQAACRVELGAGDSGGIWFLEQHLVPLCARPIDTKVGELLITLIGDAFHETGEGFAVHSTGMTPLNLDDQSPSDLKGMWDECIAS
jgi:hypothetical protein